MEMDNSKGKESDQNSESEIESMCCSNASMSLYTTSQQQQPNNRAVIGGHFDEMGALQQVSDKTCGRSHSQGDNSEYTTNLCSFARYQVCAHGDDSDKASLGSPNNDSSESKPSTRRIVTGIFTTPLFTYFNKGGVVTTTRKEVVKQERLDHQESKIKHCSGVESNKRIKRKQCVDVLFHNLPFKEFEQQLITRRSSAAASINQQLLSADHYYAENFPGYSKKNYERRRHSEDILNMKSAQTAAVGGLGYSPKHQGYASSSSDMAAASAAAARRKVIDLKAKKPATDIKGKGEKKKGKYE